MGTLKFKTNIKCSGCIAAVALHPNSLSGIEKWEVDAVSPDKILTINAAHTNDMEVVKALENAGYKAEKI